MWGPSYLKTVFFKKNPASPLLTFCTLISTSLTSRILTKGRTERSLHTAGTTKRGWRSGSNRRRAA